MNAKIGNGWSKLQGFSLVKGYFKTTIFFLVKEATVFGLLLRAQLRLISRRWRKCKSHDTPEFS